MGTGNDINRPCALGGAACVGLVENSKVTGRALGLSKKVLPVKMEAGQVPGATNNQGAGRVADTLEGPAAADMTQVIRKIRAPRTRRYIEELARADEPGENDIKIMESVKALPANNRLCGILAPCYIEGCRIHAIDRMGNILEHYRCEEEIPDELKPGYPVYEKYPGCVSVEVYTQWFCVTREDGSVKFISREEA